MAGLGIAPDVELGRRREVSFGDRAAHEHDLLDSLGAVRFEVARDVRQRAGRHERHGCSGGHLLRDERDGVGRHRAGIRLREHRPVEPALTVDVGRDDELAFQRPIGPGRDRDVGPSNELEDA